MTHNNLYENINTVLSIVSLDEINNENDFPIDFSIKMSKSLKKKTKSAEQEFDYNFSSNSNKEIEFVDEEFVTFIKPFEQKGNEFEPDDPLNSFQTPIDETLL